MGRSRSPRNRSDTEWISRALTGFGRYPDKRPPDLQVGQNGALFLDNLVSSWGAERGLCEDDIMRAVRKHMFHDGDSGKGGLRFAVDEDEQGNMIIRVMPKKGSSRPERGLSPLRQRPRTPPRPRVYGRGARRHNARANQDSVDDTAAHGEVTDENWPPPARGTVGLESSEGPREPDEPPPWKCQEDDDEPDREPTTLTKEDKLSMSLNELVEEAASHQPAYIAAASKENFGVYNNYSKTGWTANRSRHQHLQRGPRREQRQWDRQNERHRERDRERERDRHRDRERARNRDRGDDDRNPFERLSRCLSWVLMSGGKEVGVVVEDGWAELDDLAEALGKHKERYSGYTGESLADHICHNDKAGRFEIVDGRVRKVSKKERRSHREGSLSPAPKEDDDEQLATDLAQRLQVGGSVRPTQQPPRKPPGPGWSRYQDDDVVWWYYEGSCGKWWCNKADDEPQPYVEPDDD